MHLLRHKMLSANVGHCVLCDIKFVTLIPDFIFFFSLLSYCHGCLLQVERKRHIGNDIVNIVFIDGDADGCDFVPNCIKSQFTRILFQMQLD